jgi:hypothetical protein
MPCVVCLRCLNPPLPTKIPATTSHCAHSSDFECSIEDVWICHWVENLQPGVFHVAINCHYRPHSLSLYQPYVCHVRTSPLLASASALQTSSAGIVPPGHLDGVDEEYLLLALHNRIEAQSAQSLEFCVEENLSQLAVGKIRTGRLWKVFGDNNFIDSSGSVIFVPSSHKIANDGRISSAIVATNVRRSSVEPIGRVVVPRSCTETSTWHVSCIWRSRCGRASGL